MPKGIGTKGLTNNLTFKIKEGDELLKESVYNILTTRKGERVGNPSFGTTIHSFLFEPNVQYYWDALKLEVIKDIESQEDRVKVIEVKYITDESEHLVSLYVVFLSLITGDMADLVITDLKQ